MAIKKSLLRKTTIVGLCLLLIIGFLVLIVRSYNRLNSVPRVEELLAKTDNLPGLIAECRDLMVTWKGRPITIQKGDDYRYPQLPKLVRELQPDVVGISDDDVEIAFYPAGVAIKYYGYRVFKEGIKGTGDKEIAPGVWWFTR